ncbi:MAG: transglutaminase TgpA family protein [Gammaproteobacteria bacterium]
MCWVTLSALVAINSGSTSNSRAMRSAGRLLAQALPISAILFVLFPRVEAPVWHWLEQQKQARTGLSDRLEPGAIGDLALSPALAFRVKFNGGIPPRNQLYWRGPVFSHTDGNVWTMSNNDHALSYQDQLQFSGKPYRYTILQEPQSDNWVYALDMPADYAYSLSRNANYQLISSAKAGEAAEFAIVSYPEYNTGYLTKTEYRENRQLPGPLSARVAELVNQLQGIDGKPEAYIDRILDYFRRQHFSYSLHPPLMQNHFIETFLFEARTGFCNHYAAAFVYLMRAADIPARVVTGYQGGEYNPVGKFLEVRQANAHAWAEVWLEGRGWTRVDPTAAILPDRVEQDVNVARQVETGAVSLTGAESAQIETSLFAFRQVVNSADYLWQRWVVRYGTENQSLLWSRLGIGSFFQSLLWLVAAIASTLLIFAGRMLGSRHHEAPEVRLYRRFCRKMAKAGIRIHPGEGPNDFAMRAKTGKPEISQLIDEVTQIFVRLRYHRAPAADDVKQLKKSVNAISRSINFSKN